MPAPIIEPTTSALVIQMPIRPSVGVPIHLCFTKKVCVAIVRRLPPDFQAPTVILTHVRIIDGAGRPAIDDQNLVIEQSAYQG
jgi:hypothetical protein